MNIGRTLSRAGTALVAVAALIGGAAPAAMATEGPILTAERTEGLTPYTLLTVEGSGFEPNRLVGVLACFTGGPINFSNCSSSGLRLLTTDGTGAFSVGMEVPVTIAVGTDVADCTEAGRCQFMAGYDLDDPGAVTLPFTVIPMEPSDEPYVSADPSTDLVDRQSIDFVGGGFEPGRTVAVTQCRDGAATADDCDLQYFALRTADGIGNFAGTKQVRRIIRTGDGATVDCALEDCVLVAASLVSVSFPPEVDQLAWTPLHFDPEVPPVADPEVRIEGTPTVVLRDGIVEVTVTATCANADSLDVWVHVAQGRRVSGWGGAMAPCGTTSTLAIDVTAHQSRFHPGPAEVTVGATAYGDDGAAGDVITLSPRLRR